MTAIVALENAQLNKKIKISNEIRKVDGSMLYIKEGQEFTLYDLLSGLMLQSGNDSAMSIASNVMQYDKFIKTMNLKANQIGMKNTNFENPHGLNYDTKNYSTAYDMALLMQYAIKNKDFINITRQKKYKVNEYIWYNKNKLLTEYKYLLSGKIGYTSQSGQVFVSAAKKDNKTLIIASINESDKFNLHKNLYEKYFKMYTRYKVLDSNFISFKIKDNSNDNYYIKNDYYMLLKKDEIDYIDIKASIKNKSSSINIFLNNNLIHSEKLYKMKYKTRLAKLKDLLLFFR